MTTQEPGDAAEAGLRIAAALETAGIAHAIHVIPGSEPISGRAPRCWATVAHAPGPMSLGGKASVMTSTVCSSNELRRSARAAGLATLALLLVPACGSGSDAGLGGVRGKDGGSGAESGVDGASSGAGGTGGSGGGGAGGDAATHLVGEDAGAPGSDGSSPGSDAGARSLDGSTPDGAPVLDATANADHGDGNTCGNGVKDPGERCCDAAARAAFDEGLLAYVAAHAATSACIPPTGVVDQVGLKVGACAGNGCGGSPGCPVALSYHGAQYTSQPGAFGISVDGDAPIALAIDTLGSVSTCILDVALLNVPYAAVVQPVDDGYSLQAGVTQAGLGTLPAPQLSGCGAVASVIDAASGVVEPLLRGQVDSAATTLTDGLRAYQVACPY